MLTFVEYSFEMYEAARNCLQLSFVFEQLYEVVGRVGIYYDTVTHCLHLPLLLLLLLAWQFDSIAHVVHT